jgi:hypothetical protein
MAYNVISNGPAQMDNCRESGRAARVITAAARVTAAASRPAPSYRAAIQAAAAPLPGRSGQIRP